ncbi:MAG: HPr kinase/phosphatase C-terminal domain-containing protein [Pseudomonadota bacterium]
MTPARDFHLIHASCVDVEGRGLLIAGDSGTGKSALALELMALGAVLVADDQTEVRETNRGLIATAPATIKNMVEARGLGILHATAAEETRLQWVVDMDHTEKDRLPQTHTYKLGAVRLPCVHYVAARHFSAALVQLLRSGRRAPS